MSVEALSGWAALALIPLTAVVAWALRRFARGSFVARMRPHFILGYAALGFAVVHLSGVTRAMGGANGNGIWFATFALVALALQAFIGTNLQSPGAYRSTLRRWHTLTFLAALAFALAHVAFNLD